MPGAAVAVRMRREGITSKKDGGGNEYAYVEVMACPGGCTNGGGQIRVEEAITLQGAFNTGDETEGSTNGWEDRAIPSQRDWLRRVDSAYFSAASDSDSIEEEDADIEMHDPESDPNSTPTITDLLTYWSTYTSIPIDKLVYTSYRKVDSDVGKSKKGNSGLGDTERIAALAGSIGGGW